MKPKKQIDFLVEEFFNTGKLYLNKDEEGITFDQLLVESKYGHLKNKEFVLHNPKNKQDATYTIKKMDNQNDEDAYVTVLDSSKSTRNFNLRFLVVKFDLKYLCTFQPKLFYTGKYFHTNIHLLKFQICNHLKNL